jgi:Fe2+ or Zn2+ uptake regulation protein
MSVVQAQRVESALASMRAAGLRRTKERVAIVRVLAEADRHLKVPEVVARLHAEGSTLDNSTAWRTLLTLTGLGLVHALDHGRRVAYGLADRPHHHAVCTGCGQVTELPVVAMSSIAAAAEAASGYVLDPGGVRLSGRCPQCRRGEGAPNSPGA